VSAPGNHELRTLAGDRQRKQSATLILSQLIRRDVSDHALRERNLVERSPDINGGIGLGGADSVSAIDYAQRIQTLFVAVGSGRGLQFGNDINHSTGDGLPALVSAAVNYRRARNSNVA